MEITKREARKVLQDKIDLPIKKREFNLLQGKIDLLIRKREFNQLQGKFTKTTTNQKKLARQPEVVEASRSKRKIPCCLFPLEINEFAIPIH